MRKTIYDVSLSNHGMRFNDLKKEDPYSRCVGTTGGVPSGRRSNCVGRVRKNFKPLSGKFFLNGKNKILQKQVLSIFLW